MKKFALLLGSGMLFSACGFNNMSASASPTPIASSSPEVMNSISPTTSPAADTLNQAGQMAADAIQDATKVKTVTLMTQGNLGQDGTAVLTEMKDGKVNVVLNMKGGTFTQSQPAHIHVGSCPNPGAVKYPLTNVINGKSETTLNVNMDTLLKSSDKLAVNVHKSGAEPQIYTACGNLK
jgi:hypothetical protein